MLSGGYARHVLLPRGMPIAVVGNELPDQLAAPASCATATVMAAVEPAGELAGRRVAVVGAGMLGLTAAAAAASVGAAAVVSVDVSAERRGLVERFGATNAVASLADVDPIEVLLEFSGSTPALQQRLSVLDIGGVVGDFTTVAWRKLLQNAVAGLMVLAGRRAGMFARSDVAELALAYLRECLEVARAEAASLGDEVPQAIVDGFRGYPPDLGTSILADRDARRPLELGQPERGRAATWPVPRPSPPPISDLVVPLLAAASEGPG